jgi:hypothetical protein
METAAYSNKVSQPAEGKIRMFIELLPTWWCKVFLSELVRESPSVMEPRGFHHHVYKRPSLDSVHSHLNPFHTIKSYFSNIHFNIIFPHMPVSFK